MAAPTDDGFIATKSTTRYAKVHGREEAYFLTVKHPTPLGSSADEGGTSSVDIAKVAGIEEPSSYGDGHDV